MAVYAIKAKDGALAGDAAEIKVLATRKIGGVIAADKAVGKLAKAGRPSAKLGLQKPQLNLEAQGIDKNLAKRARSLWAMPEQKFKREIHKVRAMARAAAEAAGHRIAVLGSTTNHHPEPGCAGGRQVSHCTEPGKAQTS